MQRKLILIFLFAVFFSFYKVNAQSGWQWGRTTTGGVGMDSWSVATDGGGNVYAGGISEPGIMDFGGGVTLTITTSAPCVWVKYSPSGTPLWAGCTVSGATWLNNITVDPSGNLILFGSFTSGAMQIGSITLTNTASGFLYKDYFIAKISQSGTVLWAVSGGSTNEYGADFLGAIMSANGGVATDTAGNIYVTSSFNSTTTAIGSTILTNNDPSGLTYDILVAKYSPAGVPLWASSVGGSSNDYGIGIAVSTTGDVYVTGGFYSSSFTVGSSTLANPYGGVPTSTPKAYIAKFSSTGVPTWGESAGGRNGAFGTALARDNFGNIYMTGGFADTSISFGSVTVTKTFPNSELALFLVQYSPADVVTWNKTIWSASAPVWGFSVATASCGQVWVGGAYNADAYVDGLTISAAPGPDPVFIAGYNLAGGVVGYSGLKTGSDDQLGIACDVAGNVFLCSDIYNYTNVIIGPDTLTNPSSTETFYVGKFAGGTVYPDTIYTIKDTVQCGMTNLTLSGLPGYGNYYWSDGSTGATLTVTDTGTYFVYNINCGDTVVVDTFHVTNAMPDTLYHSYDTVACKSSDDSYITIYLTAPTGNNYLWYDGDSSANDSVHYAGNYWVTYSSGCSYNSDTFKVTVYSPCNVGINTIAAANNIEIYPNPANDELVIIMDKDAYHSFTITNTIGQKLINQLLNTIQTNVDVRLLPAGLYYITFSGDNGNTVRKFIKQ